MAVIGVVTSYATSLRTVGETIAYSLQSMGHQTKLYTWILPCNLAKKQFERGIVFIPFDPIYLSTWVLLQRDYNKHGIQSFTYVTVEGMPKRHLIQPWIKRDGIFISNSRYTDSIIRQTGIIPIDMVYHGINMDEIKMAKPYKEKLKEELKANIIFGTVSTAIPRKGLDRLAEAIKVFSERHPDAKFYIYTKPEGASFFEGLENAHIDTRYGKLSRVEILSLMASFDYYLCPSLSEGFCLPLVESQALGVPVICCEYEPLTEVTDPKANFRFPYEEEDWVDLGYGLLFHLHKYKIEEMVDQMENAYEIYLNQKEEYQDRSERVKEFSKQFDSTLTYRKFLKHLGV